MLQDPENIDLRYNLYPSGEIVIGRGTYRGMSVGANPLMAKISITGGNPYPDGWFVLSDTKSLFKLKAELEKDFIIDTEGRKCTFIPKWIWLDCYRYHWEQLQNKVTFA